MAGRMFRLQQSKKLPATEMDRLTVNALKEHISKLAAADDDNQDEWTDFGRRLLGLSDRMRVREMDLVEAS